MSVRTRDATADLPRSGRHIPALDGIRGIAVLVVMLSHFAQYGGVDPVLRLDRLVVTVLRAGWVGVDLFFVLSGFLITGILVDSRNGRNYFRNFLARRVLRIFPLYYMVLLLFLVFLPWLFPSDPRLELLGQGQAWYWSYLLNWHIAVQGWPEFGALGHFWTLAVEEQFYLFWPVIVFLLPPRGITRLCVAFIAGSFLVRLGIQFTDLHSSAAFVLTPARMDALATGGLVAMLIRHPHLLRRVSRFVVPVVGLSAAALAAIFIYKRGLPVSGMLMQTLGFSLISLLFGAVILLTVAGPPTSLLTRGLRVRPLTIMGQYSYGLYVFHHILLFFLPASLSVAAIPRVMGSQLPGLLVFSIAAGATTFVVAMLSWHLYEKRFLSLKRLFAAPPATEEAPVPAIAQPAL